MFRNILFAVSLLGLCASAVVHFSTFQALNLTKQSPLMGLLHIGAIVTVGGFVLLFLLDKPPVDQQTWFREVFFKPIWPMLLVGVLGFYTIFNFATNAGSGHFSVRKGQYVETMRGRVLRTFPDKRSFETQKSLAELKTTRAFSGHWLLFYGSIWILLLSARLRREDMEKLAIEQKREHQEQFQKAQDALQRGHSAHAPNDGSYSFSQRFWNDRRVKTLTYAMAGQIALVGGGILVITGNWGMPLFILVFLGMGLGVNLAFFRKQLRYFVQDLRFEEEQLHLEYFDFQTLHKLQLHAEDVELSIHEQNVRGGSLFFLELKHGKEKVFRQLCEEKGPWTKARCEAIVEEWEKRSRPKRSWRSSGRRRE